MRNRLQEKNERTRGGRPPLGTPCSSCRSSATILSALHENFIWTRFEEGLGQSRIAGRGGRAVECGGLENRWASLRSRGFESPPLRFRKPRTACWNPAREAGFSLLWDKFGGKHNGTCGCQTDEKRRADTELRWLIRRFALQLRLLTRRADYKYRTNIISHIEGDAMGRTPGAKNRTPRELRAAAKYLNEKADFLERIAKLTAKLAKKRG